MWPFERTRAVLKVCIAGRRGIVADRNTQICYAADGMVDVC